MHPRPTAETPGPWEPSERVIMSGRPFLAPTRLTRGARELRDPHPALRVFDEPAQAVAPVSSFLALTTHQPAAFLYEGG